MNDALFKIFYKHKESIRVVWLHLPDLWKRELKWGQVRARERGIVKAEVLATNASANPSQPNTSCGFRRLSCFCLQMRTHSYYSYIGYHSLPSPLITFHSIHRRILHQLLPFQPTVNTSSIFDLSPTLPLPISTPSLFPHGLHFIYHQTCPSPPTLFLCTWVQPSFSSSARPLPHFHQEQHRNTEAAPTHSSCWWG